MNDTMNALYDTIISRKENPQEGSYTNYLLDTGLNKILKKCGEESSEVIIAALSGDNIEIVGEISDLIYHLMVLMVNKGIAVDELFAELDKRSLKAGNLKQFHKTDKNS